MKQKKSILKGTCGAPRIYTVDLHGIPVEVTRKRMKNLRLRVRSYDASVHLSIPTSVSTERAMLFLLSKEAWLRKVLSELPETSKAGAHIYDSGAPFLLWGVRYTLEVVNGGRSYALTLSECDRIARLSVPKNSTPEGRERFLTEYRKKELSRALEFFIPKWESITGFSSASYDIRFMKSRWGSCNFETRHIRLNLRLTEHPLLCTEYVVLHELCHLKIPHHGKEFHALVASFLPEWKAIRAVLNGKSPI